MAFAHEPSRAGLEAPSAYGFKSIELEVHLGDRQSGDCA